MRNLKSWSEQVTRIQQRENEIEMQKKGKDYFQARTLFGGVGVGKGTAGILSNSWPLLPLGVAGGMERAHMIEDVTGADQKIPDWLIKITFSGEVETANR